jgi:hypothetical protein
MSSLETQDSATPSKHSAQFKENEYTDILNYKTPTKTKLKNEDSYGYTPITNHFREAVKHTPSKPKFDAITPLRQNNHQISTTRQTTELQSPHIQSKTLHMLQAIQVSNTCFSQ